MEKEAVAVGAPVAPPTGYVRDVTLYSLVSDLVELEREFDEGGTPPSDDNLERAQLMTVRLAELIQAKTDNVVLYDQYLEDTIQALDKRAKELEEAKRIIKNRQDRFREYVVFCMNKLEVKELRGQVHKIKLRAPSRSVEVFDENQLPPDFVEVQQKVVVKKTEIKKAIAEGKTVPGARMVEGKIGITLGANK